MNQYPIIIEPYNPDWPHQFAALATQLKAIFGTHCCEMHHAGSTAIPGLAAKPIIDIFIGVTHITAIDAVNASMADLGFIAKGEFGIAFRRYFSRVTPTPQCHVHVFESSHPEIQRHLLFRDTLRANPTLRDRYAALKQQLAKEYPNDIYQYVTGKSAFVRMVDQHSGYQGWQLVQVLTPEEQAAYISLLGTHPLNNDHHKSFVYAQNLCYKGAMHIVMTKQPTITDIACVDNDANLTRTLRTLGERWCQEHA